MAATNPFSCGFDEDLVPLDVLQAMGRLQANSGDDFVNAMRVACALDSEQNSGVPSGSDQHTAAVASSPASLLSPPPRATRQEGGGPSCLLSALKLDLPTFCGRNDPCSADVFLQQVQRYARAAHHTNQWLLLEVMPVVLVGDANRWWMSRGGYTVWDSFSRDLLRSFGPPDRERRLRQELDARTQHPNEDFGSFVRVIGAFYERLATSSSEEEMISRVIAQASPATRQLLWGRSFDTMRDLEDAGPEIQELFWRNATYTLPPLPALCMERDLAYQPYSQPAVLSQRSSQQHTTLGTQLPAAQTANNVCRRCHGVGHWARQCPSPRTDTQQSAPSTTQPGFPAASGNERR